MIFHCYVSLPEGNGFHVGFHVGIWSSNPASRLHGEVFRRASGGSGNALTLNAKSRKLSLFSNRWSEPHCSGGHDQPILTHFPPSLGLVAMIHIFNSSDPSSFFASNYSSLFGGQKKSIYASLSGAYAQTSTYLYIYISESERIFQFVSLKDSYSMGLAQPTHIPSCMVCWHLLQAHHKTGSFWQ